MSRLRGALNTPLDVRQLTWFRVFFGMVISYEAAAIMLRGDVRIFSSEVFHFTYYGFDWVGPLSTEGMYAVFVALVLAGIGISAGLAYRASALTAAVLWSYVFLIEKTFFLNHWYLIGILAWMLVAVPTSRECSVDALIRAKDPVRVVPAWMIRMFQLQLVIVYAYAGIAKLNADWLSGATMAGHLYGKDAFPVIGPLFADPRVAQFMALSATTFDLSIAFLLFWKPARIPALIALVLFHVVNWQLFNVGLFPIVGLVGAFVFLRPDRMMMPAPWRKTVPTETTANAAPSATRPLRAPGLALLAMFFAFQLLFPLRHFLYAGNVLWTGEGYFFAWHMLAADRLVGKAELLIVDNETGLRSTFMAEDVLLPQQTPDVYIDPDLLLQLVAKLRRELGDAGHDDVSIYAGVPMSLNGGPFALYADPTVDLTKVSRRLGHATWLNDAPR